MRKTTMFMIFILLCPQAYESQEEDDFVDPHDLFRFDPVNVRMKVEKKADTVNVVTNEPSASSDAKNMQTESELTKVSVNIDSDGQCSNTALIRSQQDVECSNTKLSLESCTSLFRQYVNKLVVVLEPKVLGKTGSAVEINLRLLISPNDISKLRRFGQGDTNAIHDVHETLNYMIQYSSDVHTIDCSGSWFEMKTGMSFTVIMQIVAIVLSVLISMIALSRVNVSIWTLTKVTFLLFVVVSIVFNWIAMYQKELANQEKILMTKFKDQCPDIGESWFWNRMVSYISSTFTLQNEHCKEYYQAMLVNPLVKVTPVEVVSVAIVKTFVAPLGIIGEGIKAFLIGLVKDLPAQYQLIMIGLLLIFVLLAFFFFYGYHLRIFGLISLGPSETHHIQRPAIIHQQFHEGNRIGYRTQEPYPLQTGGQHRQVMAVEDLHRHYGQHHQVLAAEDHHMQAVNQHSFTSSLSSSIPFSSSSLIQNPPVSQHSVSSSISSSSLSLIPDSSMTQPNASNSLTSVDNPVTWQRTSHSNDPGQVKRSKQHLSTVNNENQNDDPKPSAAAQTEIVHSAASEGQAYILNVNSAASARQDDCLNVNSTTSAGQGNILNVVCAARDYSKGDGIEKDAEILVKKVKDLKVKGNMEQSTVEGKMEQPERSVTVQFKNMNISHGSEPKDMDLA